MPAKKHAPGRPPRRPRRRRKQKLSTPVLILASIAIALLIVAVIFGFMITLSPEFQQKFRSSPSTEEAADDPAAAVQEEETETTDNHSEVAIEEEPEIPPFYARDAFTVNDKGWPVYETDTMTCVYGIDVSTWQGDIDWETAAADGIEFALIRVGYRGYGEEGVMRLDDVFDTYIKNAKAAGVKVGVYFFSQAKNADEAVEEAEFLLDALNGEALDLPVFIDWEAVKEEGSRTLHVTGTDIAKCCNAFVARMEEAGYTAGAYLNQHLLDDIVGAELLKDYPLWVAQYAETPDCYEEHEFWQFTDSGSLNGINEVVDLDLMFIAKADLEAWREAEATAPVGEDASETAPEAASEAAEETAQEDTAAAAGSSTGTVNAS